MNRISFPSYSGAVLKRVAVITMLIDHVTACFLEYPLGGNARALCRTSAFWNTVDDIGRMIGRIAFPIFCFLIVEGFLHTKDRLRYLRRMLLFGALSEVPFRLLFFPYDPLHHCSVYVTLILGYLAIWLMELIHERELEGMNKIISRLLCILAGGACCAAAYFLRSDYRYGGVLLIIIFYLLRINREAAVILGYIELSLYSASEVLSLGGFWFIKCYNGTRGRQSKYLYYIFYPAHLALLYLIRRFLSGGI